MSFEGGWCDVVVGAEVAFFGTIFGDEEAAFGRDEFIHGGRISGDDAGLAAHGLDYVVPPALGFGGAEVEAMFVRELADLFVA